MCINIGGWKGGKSQSMVDTREKKRYHQMAGEINVCKLDKTIVW